MRTLSKRPRAAALAASAAAALLLGSGCLAGCGIGAVSVEGPGSTSYYDSWDDASAQYDLEANGGTGSAPDAASDPAPSSSSSATDSEGIDVTDVEADEGDRAATLPTNGSETDSVPPTTSNSVGAVATWGSSRSSSSPLPELDIVPYLHPELAHGSKPATCQKYIVLHDTEGGSSPYNVVDWWLYDGKYVAAHFVVGRDGEILQAVPMDQIAHHAGFGDAGHNDLYGTTDESRDDRRGTEPIGDWAPDYGMNSYSIGIELVHRGGAEDYPEAQLLALDSLIAYIDAYYGFESQIIDHKAWRSYNSDTSPEFAACLSNYQTSRTHNGC